MIILGLGHKARQGKDTVADYIIANHEGFVKDSFAAALYDQVSLPGNLLIRWDLLKKILMLWDEDTAGYIEIDIDKIDINNFTNFLVKKTQPMYSKVYKSFQMVYDRMVEKDRDLLQWWGTEFRRKQCGEDYWIQKMAARAMDRFQENVSGIVIPDMRYPNEAQWVESVDGTTINVDRGEQIISNQNAVHDSETSMDGYDYQIYLDNSKDLPFLYKQVDSMMSGIINTK